MMGQSVRKRSGTIQRRRSGTAATVVIVFVVPLLGGCAFHGPTLTRHALGCYTVTADGWSEETGKAVAFSELPGMVRLDSTFDGNGGRRVLVPRTWKFQGIQTLRAAWGNTAGEWRRLPGDTLIPVPSGVMFHELAADSIVVSWSSWGGGVAAFLAPDGGGYSGIGQITPRQLARGLRPLMISLRRTSCGEWRGAPLVALPNTRMKLAALSSGKGGH